MMNVIIKEIKKGEKHANMLYQKIIRKDENQT